MTRIILAISAVVTMASGAGANPGGEALDFWSGLFWSILNAIIDAGGYWH